ncbi:hypothetical protein D9611_008959 [Ephemerocybe angulata]|uniref:Protein kinase domain-containing protein n=1 Tax=Ephemerocybe angulata TaxID=980116 RepID=A0A8H5FCM5_9AGAR|nr:hypothetical protein D9611_008959 [Tulosesus angulatus]
MPSSSRSATTIPMTFDYFPILTNKITDISQHPVDSGGYSSIYQGSWTNPKTGRQERVAIKSLRAKGLNCDALSKLLTKRVLREAYTWDEITKTGHKNILPFLGLLIDLSIDPRCPALVGTYCTRKHVLRFLQTHPKPGTVKRLPIIIGIARGLQCLHNHNVIHGDLKAQNVLIGENEEPLLSDFGRSRIQDITGYTTDFACVYRYIAPELLAPSDGEMPKRSKAADIYAFALLAYEVLTGIEVYHEIKTEQAIIKHVMAKNRPAKIDPPTAESDMMWKTLEECWNTDQAARPDIDSLLSRLESM